MEVTHVKDHVTHAVITGQGVQAESFGISDDPAFFHVLSSTLYRDKLRAVVRETLCNGWDAHIEAGLTNIALEVTLGTKLSIQDFGSGIHRNLIKPIYGIYGASTKKQNQNVTGGFGLGCKAPFSYVDHFEVVSCHEGEKTVYRMSKSSGAVMGKPSIQPIVTVPTDETGITVSLAVKDDGDRLKIDTLIRQIVKLGGMKVKLNGELLDSIPFENAKHGYIMVKAEDFGAGSEHSVQVRYGHVTYPIEINDAYQDEYLKVKQFIQRVARGKKVNYYDQARHDGWVLILQADPDTISVTPSRESLSMTDHTVETVKALLNNFLKTTAKQTDMEMICTSLVKEAISNTFLNGIPTNLLDTEKKVPNREAIKHRVSDYIVDAISAGGHYLLRQYPEFKGFQKKDIFFRLNALVDSRYGRRGVLQTYRAALLRSYAKVRVRKSKSSYGRELYEGFDAPAHDWYIKKFCWPILKAMKTEKMLDPKRLFVWAMRHNARNYTELGTVPFMEYGHSFGSYVPLLRGVVIVAHNRMNIEDRAHHAPMMKHWFGKPEGSLTYIVPRTGDRGRIAVDFFKKMGFHVLDLTERQAWEPEHVSTAPIPKVASQKKRPKGYPLLSNLDPNMMDCSALYADGVTRSENPEFFASIGPKSSGVVTGLDLAAMTRVVSLWGEKGVAVRSSTQANKVAKMLDAEDVFPWVRKKLLDEYKNNPAIMEYHQNTAYLDENPEAELDYRGEAYLKMVIDDQSLRDELKLPPEPADDIKMMVYIYRSFGNYTQGNYAELREIRDLIKSWGVNPGLKSLIDTINNSKTLRIMDSSGVAAALSGGSSLTPAEKTTVRTMFLTALRG